MITEYKVIGLQHLAIKYGNNKTLPQHLLLEEGRKYQQKSASYSCSVVSISVFDPV